MAGEAGLRVGLGRLGAAEQVGDGALAGPGAADHGDVQRRGRLAVEERADAVAHQGRGQAELPAAVAWSGWRRQCCSSQPRSSASWLVSARADSGSISIFSPRTPRPLR